MELRWLQESTFGGYWDMASPSSGALGEQVELWGDNPFKKGLGWGTPPPPQTLPRPPPSVTRSSDRDGD